MADREERRGSLLLCPCRRLPAARYRRGTQGLSVIPAKAGIPAWNPYGVPATLLRPDVARKFFPTFYLPPPATPAEEIQTVFKKKSRHIA